MDRMKIRRHLGIYLALLGGGLLIFVYQNSLTTTSFSEAKIPKVAFPVCSISSEEIINFPSAATGNQFSGKKFRNFTDFAFQDGRENKIPSHTSESYTNREKDFLSQTQCDKWGVMTTIR